MHRIFAYISFCLLNINLQEIPSRREVGYTLLSIFVAYKVLAAHLEMEYREVSDQFRARDSKPSRRPDTSGEKLRRWQPDNRRHRHQSAP